MALNFFKFLFFLLFSTSVYASTLPIVYYSDLNAGPKTGGQNNKGVFVTIWGNNFGSSQGGSTVAVGSGNVDNYPVWTNTKITFQLGASVTTGAIVVTTAAGSSSGTPVATLEPATFTVQSGNIYFVDPSQGSNGSGTFASPFNQMWYAYNVLSAGDTVYVETGTILDVANGCTEWHSIVCMEKSGTSGSPMSWIAYPNDTVTLKADTGTDTGSDGGGTDGDQMQYVFRSNGSSYVLVSQFNLISVDNALNSNGSNPVVATGAYWKVTGNTYQTRNQGDNGDMEVGSDGVQIYGNTDNGSYCDQYNNESHSVYVNGPSNPFEVAWNTFIGDYNMGWMIDSYHNGPRIGTMHDNLILDTSGSGNAKGMLVDGCGDLPSPDTESTMQTNQTKAYNNVIVNAGISGNGGPIQANCGTNYIYNNTIYGNGASANGMVQFGTAYDGNGGPGGGPPVHNFYNNIVYNLTATTLYISGYSSNSAPTWADVTATSNIYYGEGNGPTQDTTAINSDPKMINPTLTNAGNWGIQSGSPAISAGTGSGSYNPTLDFNGASQTSPITIGSQIYAASCTANTGTCASGATCCSGFCNASVCVAYICGDGVVTIPEVCDTSGPNLNGQSCITQGFTGGSLSCNGGCLSFNTSSCTNTQAPTSFKLGGGKFTGATLQ